MSKKTVVGIDLGTTNSEISAFLDGEVKVLHANNSTMLPSCVGLAPDGSLLVGEPARNQLVLYPERTARSIKRKMGGNEPFVLGEQSFSPPELSALILKELAHWGSQALGRPVKKAVITVPAYFSDAQRQATREAGSIAGLEVVRILNEPTAASLAYGFGQSGRQTTLIYDLGGGTFDVSIVNFEDDLTEVLASHGNNQLGGDDFDELLLGWLLEKFQDQHGVDLREGHPKALARLRWAAEEAKKELSSAPFARVREESLLTVKRKALHLDLELSRSDLESMIRPLLESTLTSVSKALESARLSPRDLEAVLLVGGSTRIPLVSELLTQATDLTPRQEINPDLAVALGAGTLASRLAGQEVSRVLVDVSPFSFGTSYVGQRGGMPYWYCYKPIIPRNTPLPLTRSELFYTASAHQEKVAIEVFQGEDEDALKNYLIGEFSIEGLQPTEEPNPVICKMSLDLDGILEVTAIEKISGLSKQVVIDGASRPRDEKELALSRLRMSQLHSGTPELLLQDEEDQDQEATESLEEAFPEAKELVERLLRALPRMHPDDAAEAQELRERLGLAVERADSQEVESISQELSELLFFVESSIT